MQRVEEALLIDRIYRRENSASAWNVSAYLLRSCSWSNGPPSIRNTSLKEWSDYSSDFYDFIWVNSTSITYFYNPWDVLNILFKRSTSWWTTYSWISRISSSYDSKSLMIDTHWVRYKLLFQVGELLVHGLERELYGSYCRLVLHGFEERCHVRW
jgi:hypothetical protein